MAHYATHSRDDPRYFGTSTDDTAIFLEDTMDEPTARCISSSFSAVAILSPQRMPHGTAADLTEYDRENIGSGLSCGEKAKRVSRPLSDLTNTAGAATLFSSKSPNTQRPAPASVAPVKRTSTSASQQRSTRASAERIPCDLGSEPPYVPLAAYQELERERNRFSKMYEHQKALYEEVSAKHADAYRSLQEKIIEVVALSTRNEENKRVIRQLKREMADGRSQVVAIQNRALEETRQEKTARARYHMLLQEQKELQASQMEKHKAEVAGLESLLNDVTSIRGENDAVQVFQLNALLKASYAKNTALFGDILRQGRQITMLFDSKAQAERQVEQLRHECREIATVWEEERRRMLDETERYASQVAEQQSSILELRQMLIRALDSSNICDAKHNCGERMSECSSSYSSEDEDEDEDEEEEEYADIGEVNEVVDVPEKTRKHVEHHHHQQQQQQKQQQQKQQQQQQKQQQKQQQPKIK